MYIESIVVQVRTCREEDLCHILLVTKPQLKSWILVMLLTGSFFLSEEPYNAYLQTVG